MTAVPSQVPARDPALPEPRLTKAGRRLVGVAAFVVMAIAGIAGIAPAGGFALGTAVYVPLERLFPRHEQHVVRPGYFTDILHLLITPLVTLVIGFVPFVAAVAALAQLPSLSDAFGRQPWALQFVEVLVIGDFFTYWIHRAMHEVKFFWRFHKIHHSSTRLDWLAGLRAHPGEFFTVVTLSLIPLVVFGYHVEVLGAFAAFRAFWAALGHANVRWRFRFLDGIMVTPEYHHWHHSHAAAAINRNYASFLPIWDIIFRSYYMPKDERPVRYGIAEKVPDTWWGQMLYPLNHP